MILAGYLLVKTIIGIVSITLAVLMLVVFYKKMIRRINKNNIAHQDYFKLERIEQNPVIGELEIYFTNTITAQAKICIWNSDMSLKTIIEEKIYDVGGHIIRWDSALANNGTYFYGLETHNQKTLKKMQILNP